MLTMVALGPVDNYCQTIDTCG